ncbi:hypothetical protein VMCG_07310 [Cytospora schulzeri]|uniref:Uncharacterized protein n=1 Tax=Cytospora schulzeri TaxID=448051 RepID=A0A423WAT7_9PEZI|nr:hypothetical protein VMCG_07310 [Valsa malicola]
MGYVNFVHLAIAEGAKTAYEVYLLANSTEARHVATGSRQIASSTKQDLPSLYNSFGSHYNGDRSYQYGNHSVSISITEALNSGRLDWSLDKEEHCLALVKALLKPGVDAGVIGKTLRLACIDKIQESSINLVKLFLQCGVDPRTVEDSGRNPSYGERAVSSLSAAFVKVLKLLTDYGFDRNVAREMSIALNQEADDKQSNPF